MTETHRNHGDRRWSAHRKPSMAVGTTNGYHLIHNDVPIPTVISVLPTRRRQRLSKTTSMLVTITFVIIFTCIIAMEVLYIDETKRLKLNDEKIPEMHDTIGVQESPLVATLPNDSTSITDQPHIRKTQTRIVSSSTTTSSPPSPSPSTTSTRDDNMSVWTRPSNRQLDKVAARRMILAGVGNNVNNDYQEINRTNLYKKPLPVVKGDWQPVLGAHDKFFVYSAYLDDRQGSFIRVLAVTRTRGSDRVHCAYWYNEKNQDGDGPSVPPIVVPANNKVIRENWNLKYSAVFVLCPLFLYNVGKKVPVPDHVSILVSRSAGRGTERKGNTAVVGNRLPVLNRKSSREKTKIVDGFAVCVKPLHYHFNRAMQLIEFIELNRILGVTHFTFYNHTIGPEVDCILREYVKRGIVTLLPWQHLDMLSQKEIRTEGLFAAINDCLYRNMYRYRYILMIDIDEFIVPHRNDTLGDVLRESTRKLDTNKIGSFSFMNSFYYLQWPNDANSRELPVPLITLQKTKRRAKFHPHKQRSKCIVVPRYVIEMGNHFVWEFLPGMGAVNVPPDIAYLHHYRVCEFGGDDCIRTQSVVDRTIYRYKTDLLHSVVHALNISRTTGSEDCQGRNYESQLRR